MNGGFGGGGSDLLTPALPGDANLDGKVDINDLTIVLAHYGQTGMTWSQGEFTGDGTVDINDLTIVLAHYNQSLASAARRPGRRAGAARAGCCWPRDCSGCWPMPGESGNSALFCGCKTDWQSVLP